MKDLYLETTSKKALINFLADNGYAMEGNYFECSDFIIDYIGKIPEVKDQETGEVTKWYANERFNVRLLNDDNTLFNDFVSFTPALPYRVFS